MSLTSYRAAPPRVPKIRIDHALDLQLCKCFCEEFPPSERASGKHREIVAADVQSALTGMRRLHVRGYDPVSAVPTRS
jgi:hypothetical protein